MLNIFVPELNSAIRSVVRDIRQLKNRNIQLWMPRDVRMGDKNFKDAKDILSIEKEVNIEYELLFYEWDINLSQVVFIADIYKCLVYQTIKKQEDWVVLTQDSHPKNQISIFFDNATSSIELPSDWYKYLCFKDKNVLGSYLKKKGFIKDFELCVGERFRLAGNNFRIQGEPVYVEKDTGRYWYQDNFHKDHIEVFDARGKKHLGEADIDTGELIPGTADKTKRPIL